MTLMYGQNISEYFEGINKDITSYIGSLSDEQILASSDEEIIEHVTAKYEVTPIEIHEDRMVADAVEGKLRYIGSLRVEEVDGMHFTVELPFTGDDYLWHLQPSTWKVSSAEGSVQLNHEGQKMLVMYVSVAINQDEDTANKLIAENISSIKVNLENQKKDVDRFNSSISDACKPAINRKRKKLVQKTKVLEAFTIPLKQSADAPDIKTLCIERKLIKPLPSVSAESKEPEYEISDKDYEHIIDVIRHVGATFESTPGTYKGFGEEQLRDVILANLNGHYKGDATGETFRSQGKTDIRIEFENRAAFVSECKMWHGEKKIPEAINQLLGYLTWRDCKTSIIIFNKKVAGFAGIQEKIPGIFESHSQHVQPLDSKYAGEWRYVLKSKDDQERKITVHVFLFNLYVCD